MGLPLLATALVGLLLPLVGAIFHLRHFPTLVDQLSLHLAGRFSRMRRERRASQLATLLVLVEALLPAVAVTGWVLGNQPMMVVGALGTAALGLSFVIWLLQLLASGSELPCACSSTSAPPTPWSLLRAVPILAAASLMSSSTFEELSATTSAVAVLGSMSVAVAVFVLPDAMQWPDSSRSALEASRPGPQRAVR